METLNFGKQILEWIQSEDKESQKRAIEQIKKQLSLRLNAVVKDPELRKEVQQEVCLIAWEKLQNGKFTYLGEGQFFQYLHRIQKVVIIKIFKREKKYLDLEILGDVELSEDEELFDDQKWKIFLKCWEKLDEACKPIIMKRINDTPYRELYAELYAIMDGEEIEESEVKKLRVKYRRCMKRLKKYVKEYLKNSSPTKGSEHDEA